jgi:hypothetical protein
LLSKALRELRRHNLIPWHRDACRDTSIVKRRLLDTPYSITMKNSKNGSD